MAEYLVNLSNGKIDEKGVYWPLFDMLTQSGVMQATSMAVSAQNTPDMTVKIAGGATGHAIAFLTTAGDMYYGRNTADKNVTITSNASGVTKTDAIVAYADLAAGSATSNNPGALKFVAVRRSGSNTGAPTSGEIASAVSSNPYVVLSHVTVGSGVSSINSGNLLDQRPRAQLENSNIEPLGTTQYGDGTVTTAKLATDAVTQSESNIQASDDNVPGNVYFSQAASSGTWYEPAGFSETITTTGGDLFVIFNALVTTSISTHVVARVLVDSTFYGKVYNSASTSGFNYVGSWLIEGVSAGIHTVKVQFRVGAACTINFYPQRSYSVTEFKK